MKKRIIQSFRLCAVLILTTLASQAQTANDNYVKVYKASKGIAGDLSTVNDKTQVQESIEYYDGLGRPLQSISRQGSRLGYDLVTFWVYDSYGRKATSYLPYASTATDGNVKSSPLPDQALFYQNLVGSTDGSLAFSTQLFENSELQRVLKISSPGAAWQPNPDAYSMADNAVKKRYEFNGSNEVYLFTYDIATGQQYSTPLHHCSIIYLINSTQTRAMMSTTTK
jgi:Domain of unknown function (DUF6443)